MLKRIKNIGPGAMVAAAFIGPGTVATATTAGAGFAYTLLWAVLFSVLATLILQEMTARLGVVGGMGLGEAIRNKIKQPGLKLFASILVISAILIGNAAYEAGNITGAVLGFDQYTKPFSSLINPLVVIIGILAFILLFSGQYKWIESTLVFLVSIMGLVFLVSAILVKPDLGALLKGAFIPVLPENALLMVVGLIGTTVVPYNLFLHASSVKKRWSGESHLEDARWDTILSVLFGGMITMAILITAAAAFEGQEKTVSSAADLSIQLNPMLGEWSTIFIAFGFLAAGLSSSITAPLAAAFATSEIIGKPNDMKAAYFRVVWIGVLLIGLVFSSLGFKPIPVILFAQAANGLLLPIIAGFLLWIMNDKNIMGKYVNSLTTNLLGFIVILITLGLGLKGLLSAFKII